MALLLTVCGGSWSPRELRCGWWFCCYSVVSNSFWWPKVSQREAGASSHGGPSHGGPCPLRGPFWPSLVTCESATCPGTWCWCSGRETPFCWWCRQSGTWSQRSHRLSRSPLGAARKDKNNRVTCGFLNTGLKNKIMSTQQPACSVSARSPVYFTILWIIYIC